MDNILEKRLKTWEVLKWLEIEIYELFKLCKRGKIQAYTEYGQKVYVPDLCELGKKDTFDEILFDIRTEEASKRAGQLAPYATIEKQLTKEEQIKKAHEIYNSQPLVPLIPEDGIEFDFILTSRPSKYQSYKNLQKINNKKIQKAMTFRYIESDIKRYRIKELEKQGISYGTYYIDSDEKGIYIFTEKDGKYYIETEESSIRPGIHGEYYIKEVKGGFYIKTDKVVDIFVNPKDLEIAREKIHKKNQQKPDDTNQFNADIESPDYAFSRKDKKWCINYKERSTTLPDNEKIRYIVHLLDSPDVKIHSFDLMRIVKGCDPNEKDPTHEIFKEGLPYNEQKLSEKTEAQLDEEGMSLSDMAIDKLTKEQKDKFESAGHNILQKIKDAKKNKDQKKLDQANKEMTLYKNHMLNEYGIKVSLSSKGLKFSEKSRPSPEAEKARKNVLAQIKIVIDDIEKKIPSLGKHLRNNIETGLYCKYKTDDSNPINWNITL